MKTLMKVMLFVLPAVMVFTACEGPAGPMGKDPTETCAQCHNRQVVDAKINEFEHSEHFLGTAFEEGSRTACAPCHTTKGFHFVTENNTPANAYVVDAATASLPGRLECATCHSKIHTTFTFDDFFPLTWTEPVDMVMWAGAKKLEFEEETSQLCAKCHQPRAVTGTGGVINYAALVSSPATTFNMAAINYRVGVHYGTEGAMNAGEGGIEFGTTYDRDHPHGTEASCATCHMAEPEAVTGGHSFIPGFKGCNTTGCHSNMSATNAGYTGLVAQFNTAINALATELNDIGGATPILQRDPVDNEYHGYLDVYDANANPTAAWGRPDGPAFPTLTNEQFGAFLNFQLLIRDGSHGIHNPDYMMDLLNNTIEAL